MSTKFQAYFIECITNMHVGSGDANYGVVDKLVQRDPVTDYPTIHASSLKGALREHFEKKWGKNDQKLDAIFGKEGKEGKDSETGEYKFLSADLIAVPVRCNFENYILAINKALADDINAKAKLLTGKSVFNTINDNNTLYKNGHPNYEVFAEDIQLAKGNFTAPLNVADFENLSEKYASVKTEDFRSITTALPVIARNNLENGVSKNLWYEQIVPHKTLFITYIGVTDSHLTEFDSTLKTELVQIGANASIGYGLCKFHQINFK